MPPLAPVSRLGCVCALLLPEVALTVLADDLWLTVAEMCPLLAEARGRGQSLSVMVFSWASEGDCVQASLPGSGGC